ncbi:hypothetical protein Ntsu_26850 [Nocardia sp. IFM 10818]
MLAPDPARRQPKGQRRRISGSEPGRNTATPAPLRPRPDRRPSGRAATVAAEDPLAVHRSGRTARRATIRYDRWWRCGSGRRQLMAAIRQHRDRGMAFVAAQVGNRVRAGGHGGEGDGTMAGGGQLGRVVRCGRRSVGCRTVGASGRGW